MARLQDVVRDHPEWESRVAVIALSIDDKVEEAREHLARNGWDQTLNLWAGPGGFRSDAVEAFRVSAIPRAVVLDTEGVVRYSGRPEATRLSELTALLLAE